MFGYLVADQIPAGVPHEGDLLPAMRQAMHIELESRSGPRVHYFPCHIFDDSEAPSFDVGPVHFSRRERWLSYAKEVGEPGQLPWSAAVDSYWHRSGPKPEELPAAYIVDALTGPWVAAVHIPGREWTVATTVAQVAVQTAVDTVGLLVLPELAGKLRGPLNPAARGVEVRIAQKPGTGAISASTKAHLPGLRSAEVHAADFLARAEIQDLLRAAGLAIGAFVSLEQDSPGAKTRQRWVEAMHWFGQARREMMASHAIVKYRATLDTLAWGGSSGGIKQLVRSLYPMEEDAKTIDKLVKKVYEEGGSAAVHGRKLWLQNDLDVPIAQADLFAGDVLVAFVRRAERYAGPDDRASFQDAR